MQSFFFRRFILALSTVSYFLASTSITSIVNHFFSSLITMNWWQILAVAVRVIQKDAEEKKSSFNPRPYFRLFLNWILDLGSPDPVFDGANFQVQLHIFSPPSSLKPCPIYLGCPLWFFPYLHWIIMLGTLTTFRSWRLLRMLSMHCSLWKFLVGGQHAAFAFFTLLSFFDLLFS